MSDSSRRCDADPSRSSGGHSMKTWLWSTKPVIFPQNQKDREFVEIKFEKIYNRNKKRKSSLCISLASKISPRSLSWNIFYRILWISATLTGSGLELKSREIYRCIGCITSPPTLDSLALSNATYIRQPIFLCGVVLRRLCNGVAIITIRTEEKRTSDGERKNEWKWRRVVGSRMKINVQTRNQRWDRQWLSVSVTLRGCLPSSSHTKKRYFTDFTVLVRFFFLLVRSSSTACNRRQNILLCCLETLIMILLLFGAIIMCALWNCSDPSRQKKKTFHVLNKNVQ